MHIVMVNLFDDKPEHLLLAKHNGHYIGCGDNGLLTMILEELPEKVVALPVDKTTHKNTLYCTSIFAKAYNEILNGKTIDEVGDASVSINIKNALRPMLGNNWIEGQIIFIDNFENVIVNITKKILKPSGEAEALK